MPPSLKNRFAPNRRREVCAVVALAVALGIVGCGRAVGAEDAALELGKPVVQRWSSLDYGGGADVAGLAAGSHGLLYAANLDGILEYDGSRWAFLPISPQYVRTLCRGEDGALYFGGIDCLGRASYDSRGIFRSENLLEKVPPGLALGVVKDVEAQGKGVWILSEVALLRYSDGKLERWSLPSGAVAGTLSVAGQRLFMSQTSGPVWEFSGNEWHRLDGVEAKSGQTLIFGLDRGGVAVVTAGKGWSDLEGKALAGFEGSSGWLRNAEGTALVCGLKLSRGGFVLGTEGAGVLYADADGSDWRVLNLASGLPRNRIRSLAEDADGGLWVGTQDGLARVDLGNPGTLIERSDGLTNTRVSGLVRQHGELYCLADDALLRLEPSPATRDRPAVLVRDDRVRPEHHARQVVSHPRGLLLASDDGVRSVGAAGVELVPGLEGTTGTLVVSRTQPDRIFIGRDKGLDLAVWKEGHFVNEGPIAGVEGEVQSVLEEADGTLWAATTTRGVFRIQRTDTDGGPAGAAVVRYDQGPEARGLPAGHEQIFLNDSALGPHFNTAAGIYRYLPKENRFEFDERLVLDGRRELIVDPVVGGAPGELWVNGIRTLKETPFPLARLRAGEGGVMRLQPVRSEVRPLIGNRGFQAALWEAGAKDGVLWVKAFGGGFVRLDLDRYGPDGVLAAPLIRGVYAEDKRVEPSEDGVVVSQRHEVQIRVSPGFYRPAPVEYQSRLVGIDEDWSEWRKASEVTYDQLEGGPFTFQVRSRTSPSDVSPISAVTFRMPVAWQHRLWVRVLEGLGVLGALWGLVRWRLAWHEKEKRRLEALVAERTRQLRVAKEAAEAASQAKSRFLAQMSHELRTPLNGILGFTQVLQSDAEVTPRNLERLRIIGSSGEHLLQMINEVLDFAKIEAGRMSLQVVPFHLSQLVNDLAASTRIKAETKGLVFQLSFEPTLPEIVLGDPQKLRQVLENLLNNAVKFTAKGSVGLRVSAGLDCDVIFIVTDTGVGIGKEDTERVFEPFQQASQGRPAEPGTGLGLPISRKLVELMGGRLSLSSEPGAGSAFEFCVALEPTVQRPADAADGRKIVGYRHARRRLLVVDDHAINRRLLREMLEPLGFALTEAEGGSEALALLAGEKAFDLLILDLRMPVLDGFAVVKRLREPGAAAMKHPVPKILAMSASVLPLNRQEAALAGCDDFLAKPFRERDILERLGRLMGLEWEYGPVQNVVQGSTAIADALPSRGALLELMQAAERGDILAVKARLALLREQEPEAAGLIERMETLALGYQMARLRETLTEALGKS